MAKRVASEQDSEDEVADMLSPRKNGAKNGSASGSTNGSSKRPRLSQLGPADTDDEDEKDQLATPAPASRTNGADSSMQVDEEEEPYEEEDGEGSLIDEDEEYQVQRGANALGRKNQKGTVAEAGVVETIIVKNIMCHKFLEVKLSPQLNFIIGANGAGKSAILTALILAFGTKASATNRGTSMANFIRRDQPNPGEITVSLRNKGPDAFKPDIYGKMIWVVRRITHEGGSSYKIQNSEKKTVSTSKSEIQAICDHFMIQMDNPVNVLNQDMAKQFIASSKPKDKYALFLKGTQLAQLTDEYNALHEQINHCMVTISNKRERVSELKAKMKEAHSKWQEIEKFKNVEDQIQTLKNELAWTSVAEIEQEASDAVKKHMDEQGKIKKIENKISEHSVQLEAIEAKVREAEAANQNEAANEETEAELQQVMRKIEALRGQVRELNSERRIMMTDVERLQATLMNHEKELGMARKLMDGSAKAKQQEARARLADIDRDIDKFTVIASDKRIEKDTIEQEIRSSREALDNARNDVGAARNAYEANENYLRGLESRKQNSLNAFGNDIPAILAAIDREPGWLEKPVGPIGRFVKLKDAKFSKVVESVLGNNLNTFVTTSEADRQRLKRLMGRFRAQNNVVTLFQTDFDWSGGCPAPDPRYTTIREVLSFDYPVICNYLVNLNRIESSIIVFKDEDGDAIMKDNNPLQTNIGNCFTLNAYQLGGVGGGARSQAVNIWRQAPRLTQDIETELRNAYQIRQETEQRVHEAQRVGSDLDGKIRTLYEQRKTTDHVWSKATEQLRRLNAKREQVQEDAKEEEPPNIQAMEDAIRETQEEIKNVKLQEQAAAERVSELSAQSQPHRDKAEALEGIIEQRRLIAATHQEKLEKATTERLHVGHAITEWRKKLERQGEKVARAQTVVDEFTARLEEAMRKAKEICPRSQVDLTKAKARSKYEHQITSLEKALRDNERRIGGSAEDIHAKFRKTKKDYEDAVQLIDDLREVVKGLSHAHEIRMNRWEVFRSHIALRARMLFLNFLTQRGFTGNLRFKHDELKLLIQVKTSEDQVKSQRDKDPTTLSGGEKSFSTICLLLSLWQAAGCPIRGLDEFDVFMDAVNRRIAIKMLMDAGKGANNTQFILISPQALNQVAGDGVKVIRIADPERGQQTLTTTAP